MSKSKVAKEFERCWNNNWVPGYVFKETSRCDVGQIKHYMHTAFLAGIQFARKEAAYE